MDINFILNNQDVTNINQFSDAANLLVNQCKSILTYNISSGDYFVWH